MKKLSLILMVSVAVVVVATSAQAGPRDGGNGHRVAAFIDENGDGFNDLAPDADGDGIPNGLDSDFVKPSDGSRNGFGRIKGASWDGSAGADGSGRTQAMKGRFFWGPVGPMAWMLQGRTGSPGSGYGPAKGTGFGGNGPVSGSGFGPGTGTGNGTGDCDGTGPNGSRGGSPDRGNRR